MDEEREAIGFALTELVVGVVLEVVAEEDVEVEDGVLLDALPVVIFASLFARIY